MGIETVEVSIVVRCRQGAHRIAVTGELDLFGADALREALTSVLAATAGRVELDLGGATFFSCAAVSALVIGRNAAGDRLVLIDAAPPVRRVLDLVNLGPVFGLPAPDVAVPPRRPEAHR